MKNIPKIRPMILFCKMIWTIRGEMIIPDINTIRHMIPNDAIVAMKNAEGNICLIILFLNNDFKFIQKYLIRVGHNFWIV